MVYAIKSITRANSMNTIDVIKLENNPIRIEINYNHKFVELAVYGDNMNEGFNFALYFNDLGNMLSTNNVYNGAKEILRKHEVDMYYSISQMKIKFNKLNENQANHLDYSNYKHLTLRRIREYKIAFNRMRKIRKELIHGRYALDTMVKGFFLPINEGETFVKGIKSCFSFVKEILTDNQIMDIFYCIREYLSVIETEEGLRLLL